MKNVVITGASGILCSEFARELGRLGYRLALLARREDALICLRDTIQECGGIAYAYAVDATNKTALKAVHEQILKDLGPCDILINGVGGNHPSGITEQETHQPDMPSGHTFFDLTQESFSYVFDVNLWSTVLACQIFAADMLGREGCCILNISSMAAFRPLTKTPAYCASKAGISNFTQWLAVHLAPCGVRVNALAPGFFLTHQNEKLLLNTDGTPSPRASRIISHTPMGRFGKPKDLLGALRFLLNEEESGFITGCILPVDGGFSAYCGI